MSGWSDSGRPLRRGGAQECARRSPHTPQGGHELRPSVLAHPTPAGSDFSPGHGRQGRPLLPGQPRPPGPCRPGAGQQTGPGKRSSSFLSLLPQERERDREETCRRARRHHPAVAAPPALLQLARPGRRCVLERREAERAGDDPRKERGGGKFAGVSLSLSRPALPVPPHSIPPPPPPPCVPPWPPWRPPWTCRQRRAVAPPPATLRRTAPPPARTQAHLPARRPPPAPPPCGGRRGRLRRPPAA